MKVRRFDGRAVSVSLCSPHIFGRAVLAAAALAVSPAHAASEAPDLFEPQSIRWKEDFAWVATAPNAPTGLDRLKYRPIGDATGAWASLGGEVRERLDLVDSSRLGFGGADAFASLQSRVFLHADLHLGPALRVFGQLALADERGRRPGDRSVDESAIDAQQLFLDVMPLSGVALRLGRQELPLGDERLSNLRESTNLRRSFDAARLDVALADGAKITAFAGAPVINRPGAFDDRRVDGESLQGIYYATATTASRPALDLFWFSRRRARSVYAEGVAKERRETLGARLHGKAKSFDYNLYAMSQGGRFGAASIHAWAASADMGWSPSGVAWSPRLSLRADVASGDRRRGDGELNTFDAPYPNTSYLSTSSAYWPGDAWSVFPLLTVRPSPRLDVYLGAQSMSRMSSADGFYYSAQNPIALASGHGQVLMRQAYGRVRWEPARRWVLTGTLIRQSPGAAVRAVGGRATSILSMSADWKF